MDIGVALRAGDLATARRAAAALRGARFGFGGGSFVADAALLDRVRAARQPAQVRSAAAAVARVVRALEVGGGGAAAAAPDPRLLSGLRQAMEADTVQAGGEVPEVTLEELGFWRSVREALGSATDRLREAIGRLARRFRDWLEERLREMARGRRGRGARLDPRLVVGLVAALALLLALFAVLLLRRRGPAPQRIAAPPAAGLAADADPLSRRESEWERFAAELAAAGRFREAIRARFHAVLVALYGGGWLHYRKGRTNWEYVAALAPALGWRSDFIRLTRTFEEEWYGGRESREESYARASEEAERVLGALGRREAA